MNELNGLFFFTKWHEREELFVEGEKRIEVFLTDLAVNGNVAPSTQNQAMNALVFLYKKVLKQELDGEIDAIRAPKKVKITVRSGKGGKDRVTTFPKSMEPLLRSHLDWVKAIHNQDLKDGFGEVFLPHALGRKYRNAARE